MKRLISIAVILLLSSSSTFAQDFCQGDFNFNGSVGAEDVSTFLEHFGRSQFNNPCPPDGPTPVPKTGQTLCYDGIGIIMLCTGTGQDGDLERGVALVTPRFTDNGDGTVTDNQTGLIWLRNANCFSSRSWYEALSDCNVLADGSCGLADGSNAGDWRLPNKRELFSLTHDGYSSPVVPDTAGTGKWSEGDPFTNVQLGSYWSSTTMNFLTGRSWSVSMTIGSLDPREKLDRVYVWPVRGGH